MIQRFCTENMDVLRFQLYDSDTLSDDYMGWSLKYAVALESVQILNSFGTIYSMDLDLDQVIEEGGSSQKSVSSKRTQLIPVGLDLIVIPMCVL
jgi:hypothetical protein